MSSDTVYTAIKTYLDANWSTTPLVYENTNAHVADTPASFVMVEISGNSYAQASIGGGSASGNMWREDGFLYLHVMVTTGSGSVTARQYARQLIALLRGASLSVAGGAVVFGDASIGLGEPGSEDGNYWRLSASITWRLDT